MKVDKDTFLRVQNKIEGIPFVQSPEWLETNYRNPNGEIVYFVNDPVDARICCFGFQSTRRFIGNKLNISGICRKNDVNGTEWKKFFSSIVEEGYDMITLDDVCPYNAEFEVAIRRSGFIRPLGLGLSPLTMYVDLQKPFAFHRNWKRNVKRSIENGNTFHKIDNPSEIDAKEFVRMFQEQKARKSLKYDFSYDDILTLVRNPKYILFVVLNQKGTSVSGRIVYISGNMAYDVYAANSSEGMSSGAIYQVQEGMLKYLSEQGIEYFDYGRIPPRSDEMDDIYLAKSYSGGHPVGYNGQWYFGKSLLLQYIMSFKSFYINKAKLY